MCHPTPGPRCSSHAYKAYISAVRKFEQASDDSARISLARVVEEKQLQLDATPRGQSMLRQEIGKTKDQEETLLLTRRLLVGDDTRKRQLAAWSRVKNSGANETVDLLKEKGVTNKYEIAAGLAYSHLLELLKDSSSVKAEILSPQEIELEEDKRILVLPLKYEGKWGEVRETEEGFSGEEGLAKVLKNNPDPMALDGEDQKIVYDWLREKLKGKQVKAVAAVDAKLNCVTIVSPEEMEEIFSVGFKLRKRTGGTALYSGSKKELEEQIKGTPFEKGIIKRISNKKNIVTMVLGVPPLPKKDTLISDSLLMSWDSRGYYQARKRHHSQMYDVMIILKATRSLQEGISSAASKSLSPPDSEDISELTAQ